MHAGSSIQSGFTLASALEVSDLKWIFSTGEEQPIPAGAVVVTEGVRGEFIYFLLEGLLAVSSAALGGREIARLGPGQIFGEMSFLEDRPTSAAISAVEDSRVLAIARSHLEARLAADPAMGARLYKALAVIAAGRLRELLGTLARWMEVEERLPVVPAMRDRWLEVATQTQHFKELIVRAEKAGPEVSPLNGQLAEFSRFMNGAVGVDSPETVDARDELGARIQREILPYFLKARTVQWLYQKPHGYPGDYEALEMIFANQPQGSGPLGPLLDRAFLDLPAIRAVRNRRQALALAIAEFIAASSTPVRVAGVGCGAADPLLSVFDTVPDKSRIEGAAVDFDTRALGSASSRRLALGLADRFQLLATNIVHLASGCNELAIQDQDLIYGVDVSDYLDDRLLLRFINQAFRKLRPGGQLLLSSFHRGNSDQAFLHHIVNWKAAHRSKEDMDALFLRSDFQSSVATFTLDSEKIMFLAACRKRS